MSAFTDLATHMRSSITLRASLLPTLSNAIFGLWFRGSRCAELQHPRFVGLFKRALRMNASQRVCRFAADWAEMFGRWRYDDNGLFAAHGVLSKDAFSCLTLQPSAMWPTGHVARIKKAGREDASPAAGDVTILVESSYRRLYDELPRPPRLPA